MNPPPLYHLFTFISNKHIVNEICGAPVVPALSRSPPIVQGGGGVGSELHRDIVCDGWVTGDDDATRPEPGYHPNP